MGERNASSTTTTPAAAAAKKQHAYDTSVFDSTQMDPWMAVSEEDDRGVFLMIYLFIGKP